MVSTEASWLCISSNKKIYYVLRAYINFKLFSANISSVINSHKKLMVASKWFKKRIKMCDKVK